MADGDRPVVVADGKHLRFMKQDGWEYVSRKGVSGIIALLAITDEGNLLLVEQYRPAVGARVVELPAGLAGDGRHRHETLELAARRELTEETGYEAGGMEYLGGGTASAGICDEVISFFRATDLNKVQATLGDGGEELTLHEVPVGDIVQWLAGRERAGSMVDLKIYVALHFSNR